MRPLVLCFMVAVSGQRLYGKDWVVRIDMG